MRPRGWEIFDWAVLVSVCSLVLFITIVLVSEFFNKRREL